MGRYSLQDFINQTKQQDRGQGFFELESDRMMEVNLQGTVWTKLGSMICYNGEIKFEREGVMEHGFGKFLKKQFTGEGMRLTKASGTGKLYLADAGKKISILELKDEEIFVNGNDVLAFQDTLKWDIKMMKKIAGMLQGGLFNVKFQGAGMVAVTTHYNPLTLIVKPGQPIMTDPNATIAWSGNLSPQLKTDVSFKTFFGRGSGESLQMKFDGDGFVVVQPYEEIYYTGMQG